MNPINDFKADVQRNLDAISNDRDFLGLSNIWIREAIRYNYAHNFQWLGRPIIQIPQDIYAIQELVWEVKPDLIIETGIAHGGSLIMSASMLAMLDYCDAVEMGKPLNPVDSERLVLGIDIDIRSHNREAIEVHPMTHLIKMIEGSSIADDTVHQVHEIAQNYDKILIFLDSNHTHDHVLSELMSYAPLTSVGSYCVVWDTGIEDLPQDFCSDRPWDKGNNPKTAVYEYLKSTNCFKIDKSFNNKLLITAAPDGYLRRIK
ncbi:cephalosporin hydroxylase family protein [bacterium]|nr:cephalosporin hydroxylase family protein [bacterium]